jgi:DNA polymerase-1
MNIFGEEEKRGKRLRFNPRPAVPKTGWRMATEFPDLSGAKAISFDVETYDPQLKDCGPGWGRGVGHIVGVAIGTDDGYRKYFPMRHRETSNNHPVEHIIAYCNDQLGRESQPKVGHNILYDLGWAAHEGIVIRGDIIDTWTAEKLLYFDREASLEAVAMRRLGVGKDSSALYDWGWKFWGTGNAKSEQDKRDVTMKHISLVPPELVGFYAESDVDLPIRVFEDQFDQLQRRGLYDVFRLECDLLPVLVKMRLAGVSVDLRAAEEAHEAISKEIGVLQKDIDKIAGRPVNTGAPSEIGPVFDRLKIEYPRTEKTRQPQLKAEFLSTIEHPIGQMIVDLQELKKYRGTFLESAIFGSQINGKIYGQFNPMRAITGRMSASDPNLQQVPSRNELSKKIRAIFVPDSGHDHWRKYDYSSIESRILAHVAVGIGSSDLRKEYRENPNTDYHTFTQDMIKRVVGISLDRKHTKTINFGVLYGMQVRALAARLKISVDDAQNLFDSYHEGLPYVRETMDHIASKAASKGYTKTVLGRRASFDKWEPRYTPRDAPRPVALRFKHAIAKWGPNIKRAYLHKALNYTIQGSAADLMKMAMVKCHKSGIFDRIGVPRLVVHDELDWSVPEVWDEEAFSEMKHTMETAIAFRVPIKVEGEWGPNWGELYPLD